MSGSVITNGTKIDVKWLLMFAGLIFSAGGLYYRLTNLEVVVREHIQQVSGSRIDAMERRLQNLEQDAQERKDREHWRQGRR